MDDDFDLADFLPYLLNQAAETASLGFQAHYRRDHGMLRTEWRVLFHLGRYGAMTAKEICTRAGEHKTKVSRAVTKLEARRFVRRAEVKADRRHALLSITEPGLRVYRDLSRSARAYDAALSAALSEGDDATLRRCLKILARAG